MADLKSVRQSKSKSSNGKFTKFSSTPQFPTNSTSTLGATSGTPKKARSGVRVPGSILEKLDLEYLKESTLKNMKAGISSTFPAAREACIEYALDMVIGNLILNGHLDPKKAQQMRNPLMKSQIAAICDDMISAKMEISKASIAKSIEARKKPSKSSSKGKNPSRPKSQRWAIQPAALPITIITTDQNIPKLSKFAAMEKVSMAMKDTGSVKSFRNVSVDDIDKKQPIRQKQRTKSLDSSTYRNINKPEQSIAQSAESEKRNSYHQQASSEVPSSNSLENNLKNLSNANSTSKSNVNKVTFTCQGQGSVEPSKLGEDSNKNLAPAGSNVCAENDTTAKLEGTTLEPPPSAIDRNQLFTPAPEPPRPSTLFSSTRTLNSLIDNSNCSLPSTASTGYQILVDLKGFQNDEISMEVEGRQLVFLASRQKRGELNIRKVTEIVDVPAKVNMENLKIGRRIDGYVIVEEHDP